MAIAVFNYLQWAALFPALGDSVDEATASGFFSIAGFLLDNSDCSPVPDVNARLTYLNYVTAHLAALSGYPVAAGQVPSPSGVIGRVSSATEGTVSVDSEWGGSVSKSEAFWLQSQYGAIFWQLTRWLRTARYVPAPPRYFGPGLGGRAGRFGYP